LRFANHLAGMKTSFIAIRSQEMPRVRKGACMTTQGIGERLRRKEDRRYVCGQGEYARFLDP
jgi:hypothetical protein